MKGTDINNGDWPGNPMKFALINDYGERQYVAYIPVEYDCYIINNGKGNNDPGGAQTVDLSVTSSVGMYMDKQGSDGKWTIGTWSPNFYDLVIPDKTEPTTVVTEPSSEVTGPTETTAESTPAESSVTEPSSTIPADGYLLGDADSNGKVNVKDATAIQKVIALLEVSNYNNKAANVDGNAFVNVKDATMIQKWVALLLPDSDIGTLVK